MIGKHGRIADSIRTIIYAVAACAGRNVTLEIVQDRSVNEPRFQARRRPARYGLTNAILKISDIKTL